MTKKDRKKLKSFYAKRRDLRTDIAKQCRCSDRHVRYVLNDERKNEAILNLAVEIYLQNKQPKRIKL